MILTIGPGGCGFTFLNWTISYLRGDVFYTGLDGQQRLVDIDILDGRTAHNFKKDHLKIENSKEVLTHGSDRSIVYLTPGSQQDFLDLLKFSGKKVIFDNSVNAKELLARSCLTMPPCEENIMVFVDQISEKHGTVARQVFLECAHFFVQYYQLPSQLEHRHFPINYLDMFQHLESRLPNLFEFLEISVDQSRIENWKQIYQIYRARNVDLVEQFLGSQPGMIDAGVKKSIFKDILQWRHGHYRHIKPK